MQDEDFQDFQSAQPSISSSIQSQLAPSPISPASNPLHSQMEHENNLIDHPFSQIMSGSSEKNYQEQSNDRGDEVPPPLNKIISGPSVPLDQLKINFSKTQSYHDVSKQQSNPFDFLSAETTSQPGQSNNGTSLNSAQIKEEATFEDQDKQNNPLSVNDGQFLKKCHKTEYIDQQQLLIADQNLSRNISPHNKSENFVFQSTEHAVEENIYSELKQEKVRELENIKQSDDFQFEQPIEVRQQSDQFQITLDKRKEIQEFEFQSAQNQKVQNHLEQQAIKKQQFYSLEWTRNKIESENLKIEINKNIETKNENIQIDQASSGFEKQLNIAAQNEEKEDDDQFGDFQETQQAQEIQEKQQHIKIDAEKVPFDANVSSKGSQLRVFVAGLPNYSFVLISAFKTV